MRTEAPSGAPMRPRKCEKVVADRKRRGREDPGAALGLHQFAEPGGNFERREGDGEAACSRLDPAQAAVRLRIEERMQRIGELGGPARALAETRVFRIGGGQLLRQPCERIPRLVERGGERFRQGVPFEAVAATAIAVSSRPAQSSSAATRSLAAVCARPARASSAVASRESAPNCRLPSVRRKIARRFPGPGALVEEDRLGFRAGARRNPHPSSRRSASSR